MVYDKYIKLTHTHMNIIKLYFNLKNIYIYIYIYINSLKININKINTR